MTRERIDSLPVAAYTQFYSILTFMCMQLNFDFYRWAQSNGGTRKKSHLIYLHVINIKIAHKTRMWECGKINECKISEHNGTI